jgi:hypothetical protein
MADRRDARRPRSVPGGAPARADLKVFLSYSRTDKAKTERLLADLKGLGFTPFIDVEDISPGEPWRERLAKLIAAADTVLFLVSPSSAASEYVTWEVNEAERLQKRLFPVVIEETAPDATPGRLQRLNFVFLRNEAEWTGNLPGLEQALLVDFRWIREHTRYTEAAARWIESGRRRNRLLSGPDIGAAERWRDGQPAQGMKPTRDQLDYIAASRRRAVTSARRLAVLGLAGVIVFAGLAVLANEARVSAGLAALRAELVADAGRIIDAAGLRDQGAVLGDAVRDYAVAQRELGEVPFPVWNALRTAYEKSRLVARHRSVVEPMDFEQRQDGGLTLTTDEGDLVMLDAAYQETDRRRFLGLDESMVPAARIVFATSRQAVAVHEVGGTRFAGLDGKPLFQDRLFEADTYATIDAGNQCVVRTSGGHLLTELADGRESEITLGNEDNIGAPVQVQTNADCSRVLLIGASGNALWARRESSGRWTSAILDGGPGDRWTASPDLSSVAAYAGGNDVYLWREPGKDWTLLTLFDQSRQAAGAIEALRITTDQNLLVHYFRSSAIYSFDGALLVQPDQAVAVSHASYRAADKVLMVWDRTSRSYADYDAHAVRAAQPLLANVDLPESATVATLARCGDGRLYVGDLNGAVLSYAWSRHDDPPRLDRQARVTPFLRRVDCGVAGDVAVSDDAVLPLTGGGAAQPVEASLFMNGAFVFERGDGTWFRGLNNTISLMQKDGHANDEAGLDRLDMDDLREIIYDPELQEAMVLGAMTRKGERFGAVRFVKASPDGRLVITAAPDFPEFDFVAYAANLGRGRYAFVGLPGMLALYDRTTRHFREVATGLSGVATRIQPVSADIFAIGSSEGDLQLWSWQGARLDPSPSFGGGASGLALVAAGRQPGDLVFSRGDRSVEELTLSGSGLMRLACAQLARLRRQPADRVEGCAEGERVSPWLRRFTPVYSLEEND